MIAPPQPIQLAFQGGGANIVHLLAAAEAIQNLEGRGELRVTKVSGTSAGAIVGTILAAKINIGLVCAKLQAFDLSSLAPNYSKFRSGIRFFTGRPLWNEHAFKKLLETLLDLSSKPIRCFSDIKREYGTSVQVLSADLVSTRKIVSGDDSLIITSLLDSAGIPFVLRSSGQLPGTIIDGGICENLPSDLLTETEADGPVVGVSFRPKVNSPPSNIVDFSLAVMDTAIQNSIARARERLGESLFEITSRYQTLDLKTALKEGFGDSYKLVRNEAEQFFTAFLYKRNNASVMSVVTGTDIDHARKSAAFREMISEVGRMYRAQHRSAKVKYLHCRIEVTVHASATGLDEIRNFAKYRSLSDPVYCHRVALPHSGHATTLQRATWTMHGPDERPIKTYKLLMDQGETPDMQELLLFFDPVLPPNSGPYQLRFRDDVRAFFAPLLAGRRDGLFMTFQRAEGDIELCELVVHFPQSFQGVRIIPLDGVKGRFMDLDDLSRFQQPIGYFSVGFESQSVPSETVWGVNIYPS